MDQVKRRRAGLIFLAVLLVVGLFAINALLAFALPGHPAWMLLVLLAVDLAGFFGVLALFHLGLDPPDRRPGGGLQRRRPRR
jgi:hypothetical protein